MEPESWKMEGKIEQGTEEGRDEIEGGSRGMKWGGRGTDEIEWHTTHSNTKTLKTNDYISNSGWFWSTQPNPNPKNTKKN